jgi:hypothetical protein
MSVYLQTVVVGNSALLKRFKNIYEYKCTSPKVKIHSRICDMWSWQIQHRSSDEQKSFRGAICTVPSGLDNAWLLLSLKCGLERKEECSAVDENLLSDGGKYLRQFKYSDQNKVQKYSEKRVC